MGESWYNHGDPFLEEGPTKCLLHCLQAHNAEEGPDRVDIPATALWQHLGQEHDLPWSLGLRVEVDGVMGERHDAVMQGEVGRGCYVLCAAAFCPLVGKQHVAWRFMQPDTLVYAVKMPGCSVAAAEGGEAGCSVAAAKRAAAPDTTTAATTATHHSAVVAVSGQEVEGEEGGFGAGALATSHLPSLPLGPHAHLASTITIQVIALSGGVLCAKSDCHLYRVRLPTCRI